MEIDNQKLNITSDVKAMAAQNEEIEKDSGIEESMETSPQSETQLQKEDVESDSDDEICVRSHQRQSRVIADDDDDDSNMVDIDLVPDNGDDNKMVDIDPVQEDAAVKENDVPPLLDKVESDEEDSLLIIKKKKKSFQNLLDSKDILSRKDLFKTIDDDIFDANGSDSEEGSSSKDRPDDENDDDDDEGFDISALSDKLKAALKKGAKKKPKNQKARASKTLAEEKLQLHSETQRLIRESKVHIPYHQPEPKSLNDFLNRAMRKQQQYRSLKNKFQDEQKKVEFVQDTIMNDSILFKKASSESATQNSQEDSSQVTETTTANNSDNQSQDQAPKLSDPRDGDAAVIILDSEVLSKSPENSSVAPETKETEIDPEAKENEEDDEELPDLIISEEPVCEDDSTKNVEEPEIFEAIPLYQLTKNTDESVPEMRMDDSSAWVSDENGLLKMDDPLMVELVASDGKVENVQMNDEASLGKVNLQEETKESEKSEENKDTPKQSKLSVSQLITPEIKNIKPKLSGSWDQPIIFDDNQEEAEVEKVKNTGIDKLMQRLLKHSNFQKEPKESKKVNIKIIQKEQTAANKEELCLNTITYQSEEPEEIKLKSDKPGAKLLLLKDKLQQQMRIKRDFARQKRCEIFNLNNEDGYEGQEEENEEEEEEAELTDGSDTDVSEEDLIENDLGEDYGKEKRSHSAFVDEEAEEDEDDEDVDDDGEEEDLYGEKKSDIQSKKKRREDDEEGEALFDSSSHSEGDSDSDSVIPESQNRPRIKKIIKNLILSDEESQNASIQYKDEKAEKDLFQKTDFLGTFSSSTSSTTNSNGLEPKTPSSVPFIQPLTMPADDSQDLYKSSSDFQSPDLNSQNLRFPLESQASPMFDEQGFLRVKTLTKTVHEPKISALGELCDNDDKGDDILGLCSGKFSNSQDDRVKSCRTLFADSQPDLQFPASGSFSFGCQINSNDTKAADGDEETEDFPSLKLISDDEDDDYKRVKDDQSENEDDDDDDDDDEADDTEREERSDDDDENNQAFPKFRMKSMGKIRREFVDEEAELSGSEFDSDENDDLNDEFDVMEEEEGDHDVNLSEDQLRNQVGRVHLKNMIDDDKREVMRLQEMYLPDGDLFSEGHGRTRRFRWKNLDDNSQQDIFNTESETEEKEEEEETNELKWRIERFEREKWIQEQEAQEKKHEEESPFLKFGRVFLKKKGTAGQKGSKKLPVTNPESPKQSKLKMVKKGSFLSRSGDSLAKIAEMTQPVSNLTVTNKMNGRNFVFSVVTPDTEEPTTTTGPEKKKKATESRSCQPAKKRKIEPVKRTLSESSVFRHLDKSFT